MFSATYFTYDGVNSATYGLKIASFDSSVQDTTSVYAPTLNSIKTGKSKRFMHSGISYDTPLTHPFSIMSQSPITEKDRRRIISWLCGRNEYKSLKIQQNDLCRYTYKCVFTAIDMIYFCGNCVGFNVTASFDSPYAYDIPQVVTSSGGQITVNNRSDIPDDYVYPFVTITSGGGDITITNNTETFSRPFKFTNLSNTEVITVDNELKIISSTMGGDKSSNFNKNWLRLLPGNNSLSITGSGTVRIECPTYVMIGF